VLENLARFSHRLDGRGAGRRDACSTLGRSKTNAVGVAAVLGLAMYPLLLAEGFQAGGIFEPRRQFAPTPMLNSRA